MSSPGSQSDSSDPTDQGVNELDSPQGEVLDQSEVFVSAQSEAVASVESAAASVPVHGWHRGLLLIFLVLTIGYSIGVPLLLNMNGQEPKSVPFKAERMPLAQAIQVHSMEAFAVLWVLSLGGTVGSFLNVVVYRMPRGKSVIFNPSRCPKCNSNIRPTDNVPIFGWLRLEGKCRDCRNPISARYPTVEAVVALLFLLLFAVELVSGGFNIPFRTANIYAGIVWILFEMRWDLIELYLYHCILFSLLVSWMLIDLDRQRVTWLAIAVSAAILILPCILWPHLQPVPVDVSETIHLQSPLAALASSLSGGAVGLVVGSLLSWLYFGSTRRWQEKCADGTRTAHRLDPVGWITEVQSTEEPRGESPIKRALNWNDYCIQPSHRNLASMLFFLGLTIGWQSTLNTLLLALALRLLSWLPMSLAQYRLPLSTFLVLAAAIHHFMWAPLFELSQKTWLASSLGGAGFGTLLVSLAASNWLIADSTDAI